jgi:hypothetical protein
MRHAHQDRRADARGASYAYPATIGGRCELYLNINGRNAMPKFFIEVPHGPDARSCITAIRVFLETGSHFLTNAEWGCKDGVHKAWFIIDVDNKEEARDIVPFVFRREAKITELTRFSMDDIKTMMAEHGVT